MGGKKESGQLRFGGKERPFKKPYLFDVPKSDYARWKLKMDFFEDKWKACFDCLWVCCFNNQQDSKNMNQSKNVFALKFDACIM